nr:MAG TPA: baseplate wedge protein [Caudoviricetes sp.]
MDILLDNNGDLQINSSGDIEIKNSVRQKIRTRLLWIENEWRWNPEEGLPYFSLLDKNPDIDEFESLIREKIFEVDEVTEVGEVTISYDIKERIAAISYVAMTDFETIREEVLINVRIRSN